MNKFHYSLLLVPPLFFYFLFHTLVLCFKQQLQGNVGFPPCPTVFFFLKLCNWFAGNFLFSFRPEITDDLGSSKRSLSVSWSDDFKGGKAVRLTGIFDKLNYKVRKAFSVEHVKCSFSTAHCSLKAEGAHIGNMHFLIQSIGRNVPVMLPDKSGDPSENRNSPVALQEQKEIFLLPTVRVSNLLQSEIHVLLTETGNNRKHSGLMFFCNVV